MKLTFLAAVLVLASAAVAVAQLPASPYTLSPGVCAGGQCRPVQAAVQTVRSAGSDALHFAGDLVGGPLQYRPAVTPAAQSIPQQMPGPTVSYPVTQPARRPVRDALRRLVGR